MQNKEHIGRYESIEAEIVRRVALGLSVISFTLIGACFALSTQRQEQKKQFLLGASLVFFILISFILGKSFKYYFFPATLNYLIPQVVAIYFSIRRIKLLERGLI